MNKLANMLGTQEIRSIHANATKQILENNVHIMKSHFD